VEKYYILKKREEEINKELNINKERNTERR
jgi:hypothetical protein